MSKITKRVEVWQQTDRLTEKKMSTFILFWDHRSLRLYNNQNKTDSLVQRVPTRRTGV